MGKDPKDNAADQKNSNNANTNNPAYKAATDNKSDQKNPNNQKDGKVEPKQYAEIDRLLNIGLNEYNFAVGTLKTTQNTFKDIIIEVKEISKTIEEIIKVANNLTKDEEIFITKANEIFEDIKIIVDLEEMLINLNETLKDFFKEGHLECLEKEKCTECLNERDKCQKLIYDLKEFEEERIERTISIYIEAYDVTEQSNETMKPIKEIKKAADELLKELLLKKADDVVYEIQKEAIKVGGKVKVAEENAGKVAEEAQKEAEDQKEIKTEKTIQKLKSNVEKN